ncbi:hypothetical protein E4V42_18245 [Clostridium estertheticum]|uniref:Uncharacterized protein n=2 Tax=Clostridium estertheticum TaxID=238834 RepID=A0A5N7J5K4_9CLOT|nr:hypothetical protein [Clostridium estertheticum]MPQ64025.1 hypothetical protein [Clostridium estertheticum]
MLGNLLEGLGGQDGNLLGNLLGSLGGQDNILGNLMDSLGGQSNNMNGNSNNGSNSGNVKSTPNVAKNNKNNSSNNNNVNINNDTENNDIVSSDKNNQDNVFTNIFSGMGNIDLSEISNMLSGIDLNNLDLNSSNFNDMVNPISNNDSFVNDDSFENNDVEFKHTSPMESTHSILDDLEDEDKGQLIYILAHLVDEQKLGMLNRIVEENSNLRH